MKDYKEIMDLAEMFDTIISSDNPAVQRSLQYTAVLAKLAEERQNMEGPFHRMLRSLEQLKEEVQQLRRSVQILENQNSINPVHDNTTDLFKGLTTLTTSQIHAMVQPPDLSTFGITGAQLQPLTGISLTACTPYGIVSDNSADSGH
jgi:U3 small nucleolar RNA-associated protein 14